MPELHDGYGRAVRVAPNEVSFNSGQSYKVIHSVRPGHKLFMQGAFYHGGSTEADRHHVDYKRDGLRRA
ncbi:hypothetical protein DL769_006983 [Monosporascus sp. CRB-8-3]|nr:hypothetical protein DL769_006983 [Monosporascus sp. CRB-8-3]